MKKIVFLVVVTLFLNGCFQMVAYMGPAITGVTGGNISHSALSYGLSYGVKKATGKTPIEQVISLTKEKQERARNKEKQAKARKIGLLSNLLSQHLETVAPVLSTKN
jgi:CRISPR/Cas system-associated protein Cas10 (large subunit of type III CRISPR-Cas system)